MNQTETRIDIEPERLDPLRFSIPNACPICLSRALREVADGVSTIHPRSTTTLSLMECRDCGHWFMSPVPEQSYLSELYAAGSLSVLGENWEGQTTHHFVERDSRALPSLESSGHRIAESERRTEPSDYLELGPGGCTLLDAFRGGGWNAWGVEAGSWARGTAKFVAEIADLPPELLFDVIVAHDVLEHVSRPGEVLQALRSRLRPGGRIYLAFPNCDSASARLRRDRWSMVRPIGHLHYFSRRSVRVLVGGSGLALASARATTMNMGGLRAARHILKSSLIRRRGQDARTLANFAAYALSGALGMGDQWNVRAIRLTGMTSSAGEEKPGPAPPPQ